MYSLVPYFSFTTAFLPSVPKQALFSALAVGVRMDPSSPKVFALHLSKAFFHALSLLFLNVVHERKNPFFSSRAWRVNEFNWG